MRHESLCLNDIVEVADHIAEFIAGADFEAFQNSEMLRNAVVQKRSTIDEAAQGRRIVDAKKSKYYDAAFSNFERARDCYRRAGLTSEWQETVRRVRAVHHRKTGFMRDFDALATGAKLSEQPSFLELAKKRWSKRHGGDDA
jgi:uncharacterized protein with HEPN domain